jgi:large-conductance mechanosensitive channel
MILLIRFILVFIIIYLLVRSFSRYFNEVKSPSQDRQKENESKSKAGGISKEIGEYVDYEEVD